MTDTTAGGRGGVGIRLFVQGGEVVKRTFDQVGASGRKMWAEIAMGDRAANPALRAMSRASGEAQEGVQGLARRAGPAANVLGAFGTAGVAAAAGVGALTVAVSQAREAMRFADEIDDSANRLNVGVEALQEYRYAIIQVGGEAKDADAALGGFQKKMGEAMAGGRAAKWFAQLGLDDDALRAFDSTDAALQEVIDRISDMGTEAERSAVAEKLGLGPLIPLLRDGAAEVARLRQAAQDLGWVMEEDLIRKGAEANQQFENLSYVVGIQLKSSFVELSDEVVGFTQHLADALAGLNDFLDRFGVWRARIDAMYPGLLKSMADGDPLGGLGGALGSVTSGRTLNAAEAIRNGLDLVSRDPVTADQMRGLLADRPGRERTAQLTPPERPGRRSGGSAARDAERRAREQERVRDALAREEADVQRDWIRATYGPGGPMENRHDLALALATVDKEEEEAKQAALRKQLEDAGVLDAIAEARLEELKIARDKIAVERDAAILAEEARELASEKLKAETARDEDAIDLLAIDEQMARSAHDRLEISRRILILQQELERKLLEASIDEDGSRTDDEQAQLDRLGIRHGREVDLFDYSAREEMREQFKSYGHEVVQAIEDGRIGAHIADEMKARLIDMALDGLFNFLNPRGGGSSGDGDSGFWSAAGSFAASMFGGGSAPGRAGGGDLWRGRRHPVAETGRPELMLIGGKGQVTSAAETARLLQDAFAGGGNANGGRTVINEHHHHNDFTGAVMTQDLIDQMNAIGRRSQAAATRDSLMITRRGAPKVQQNLRRLGTP